MHMRASSSRKTTAPTTLPAISPAELLLCSSLLPGEYDGPKTDVGVDVGVDVDVDVWDVPETSARLERR
jgi:hypothetical protein